MKISDCFKRVLGDGALAIKIKKAGIAIFQLEHNRLLFLTNYSIVFGNEFCKC
jgi:hypothetical protein